MRSLSEKYDWRPIETAPLDEDVEVLVTDICGSLYRVRYPCRRTPEGWVSAIGSPLTVTPVKWMPFERSSPA
jgi:hypothetical protein